MNTIIIDNNVWNYELTATHIKYSLQSDIHHNALIGRNSKYWEYYRGISIMPEIMKALHNHAEGYQI